MKLFLWGSRDWWHNHGSKMSYKMCTKINKTWPMCPQLYFICFSMNTPSIFYDIHIQRTLYKYETCFVWPVLLRRRDRIKVIWFGSFETWWCFFLTNKLKAQWRFHSNTAAEQTLVVSTTVLTIQSVLFLRSLRASTNLAICKQIEIPFLIEITCCLLAERLDVTKALLQDGDQTHVAALSVSLIYTTTEAF